MNESAALQVIQATLAKVLNKAVTITPETDLVAEELLDSLDGMVFLLELEQATGHHFPEEGDLVAEGYFRVPRLIQLLAAE